MLMEHFSQILYTPYTNIYTHYKCITLGSKYTTRLGRHVSISAQTQSIFNPPDPPEYFYCWCYLLPFSVSFGVIFQLHPMVFLLFAPVLHMGDMYLDIFFSLERVYNSKNTIKLWFKIEKGLLGKNSIPMLLKITIENYIRPFGKIIFLPRMRLATEKYAKYHKFIGIYLRLLE